MQSNHVSRQARQRHRRAGGVAHGGPERDHRPAALGEAADDAAMSAGGHIAARPSVAFLHLTGGEDALVLEDDYTELILAVGAGPHAGCDVAHRVDDVSVA